MQTHTKEEEGCEEREILCDYLDVPTTNVIEPKNLKRGHVTYPDIYITTAPRFIW